MDITGSNLEVINVRATFTWKEFQFLTTMLGAMDRSILCDLGMDTDENSKLMYDIYCVMSDYLTRIGL